MFKRSLAGTLLISCCTLLAAPATTTSDLINDLVTPATNQVQPDKKPAKKQPAKPAVKPPAAAIPRQPGEQVKKYMIPCLTVFGNTDIGELSYLPMRFTRNNGDHPLRIQIGDDTPHGSCETIRINVWMAAVTAAMLRNDTLHGVNISVDFSGNIDGNSAGGVTCLAILSAIDGLPLPNDFAMTGTIMPDGSIGAVGGVHAKIRAAANQGKKRVFIPSYPRFEKDSKGNEIDLIRLGDELNIKVFPVSTITEAYALIHRKPQPQRPYVNISEISIFSRKIENVLTRTFRKYQRLVRQKVKASPDKANIQIIRHHTLSPARAEAFFDEGKLLFATLQMIRTYKAWLAFEHTINFYVRHMPDRSWEKRKFLKEYYLRKSISTFKTAFDAEINKFATEKLKLQGKYIAKHYPNRNMHGFFPFLPGQTEITAQLELMDSKLAIRGALQILKNNRPSSKYTNTANAAALDKVLNNEINIAATSYLLADFLTGENQFYASLAATMPQLRHNRYAAHVEELFYAAAISAKSIAKGHIGRRLSQQNSTSAEQIRQRLLNSSQYNTHLSIDSTARYSHYMMTQKITDKNLLKPPSSPAYHLQTALKLQVYSFVHGATLMILYGPDMGLNSGFLPQLLRNARASAIQNIHECIRSGIPCIGAINDFETAEVGHRIGDDDNTRLINYWRASLYAKALLMSFKKTK